MWKLSRTDLEALSSKAKESHELDRFWGKIKRNHSCFMSVYANIFPLSRSARITLSASSWAPPSARTWQVWNINCTCAAPSRLTWTAARLAHCATRSFHNRSTCQEIHQTFSLKFVSDTWPYPFLGGKDALLQKIGNFWNGWLLHKHSVGKCSADF